MKIGIIGSGISGLSCAWILNKDHDITLFEKNDYLGGHSNTASINYTNSPDGKIINVDTGFIVFNHRTYPNLKAFFEHLKIPTQKSNMSFGIKDLDSGFEYSGDNLTGLFAQKKNLFNLKFLKMLKDIIKFNKNSIRLIENGEDFKDKTLGDFIDGLKLGEYFKNYYLFPMAGAIWSCPLGLIKNYPAKTFLQFFYNHGLLTILNQPQWYTVMGGSKEYVKKMSESFKDKIKLNCNIIVSKQDGEKIILTDDQGENYSFDHVIFASHADQTHRIISDKTPLEEEILSKVKYSDNIAVLHKDQNQMPKNKKAWASWIYLSQQKEKKVALSYWMNNLQNIDHKNPLFVTLNPIEKIDKKNVFGEYHYQHPIFDANAIKAQENLDKIQGKRNIWFCGAWTKYGFHEDGLNSAINVAEKLETKAPWKK
ncbi:MAG: putative NAD/FAD-binding protein [Myxococcota bacterium]|jgi:predicted NAD/FAD-binding protein